VPSRGQPHLAVERLADLLGNAKLLKDRQVALEKLQPVVEIRARRSDVLAKLPFQFGVRDNAARDVAVENVPDHTML
jgi:hypothetical protein